MKKLKSLFLLSLVGSGLGKDKKADNQTEINLNSLPQMGANFTKREDNSNQTLLFAGYPIIIESQKNCTTAFMGSIQGVDVFITSARCLVNGGCESRDPPVPCRGGNIFDNVYGYVGNDNVKRIGKVYEHKFGDNGLDYASVSLDSVDWNTIPYTVGFNNETFKLLLCPVNSYLTLTEENKGAWVCAYGTKSGYFCGTLNEVNVEITIPNPWYGNPTALSVNQVHLGFNIKNFEEADIGGPVYVQGNNSDNEIVTAQALGHITSFETDERTGRKYFYYTPIEKVLSTGIIELTTFAPLQESVNNKGISPKADNLQKKIMGEKYKNQIEIPPKK